MSNQPKMLSNSVFIQGGLYPGGIVQAKEFCYRLWDYGGTQPPNSNLAVYCLGTPLDGSNEGKDVEIYWNIGSAADFQPVSDGAFIVSGTREGISTQCNWHFAHEKFVVCGLKPGDIDGPSGIRSIIGSRIQLARMPGPKREFQQDPAPAPGQPQRRQNNDVLVPVRVEFAWNLAAGRPSSFVQQATPAPMQAPMPVQQVNGAPNPAPWPVAQQAPMQAPMAAPAPAPAPAPVPMGGPQDDMSLGVQAISAVLSAQGGPVEVTKLWVPVNGHLATMPMDRRVKLLPLLKDQLAALAMANNWQYDGNYLSR